MAIEEPKKRSMKTCATTALFVLATTFAFAGSSAKHPSTDVAIKKAMIRESIESYPGSCPCPYSTARNGSRCGKRSAYSRAGGYETLCFESDITKDMLKEWKAAHAQADSAHE